MSHQRDRDECAPARRSGRIDLRGHATSQPLWRYRPSPQSFLSGTSVGLGARPCCPRLCHGAVDAAAHPGPDRACDRRALPRGSRLAGDARARLVAPEADHARTGARRGGHRSLGPGALARGKKARRQGATIVFLDESGFSQRPPVRRTWAPRGQTPVLIHRQRSWPQLSAIGALAYRQTKRRRLLRTNLYLKTLPCSVQSTDVIRFLRHLRRHVRGPVILLWDGGRALDAAVATCKARAPACRVAC